MCSWQESHRIASRAVRGRCARGVGRGRDGTRPATSLCPVYDHRRDSLLCPPLRGDSAWMEASHCRPDEGFGRGNTGFDRASGRAREEALGGSLLVSVNLRDSLTSLQSPSVKGARGDCDSAFATLPYAGMNHLGTILTAALALYALGTGVFLISENRRPQATLAWMLVFIFAPGIGVLIYVLFGRDRKAFSKQRELLRQDLGAERTSPPVADALPSGYGDRAARSESAAAES